LFPSNIVNVSLRKLLHAKKTAGNFLAPQVMQFPTSPQKEYGYRNGQLLITAEPPSDSGARINVARAANGGVATASSVYASGNVAASTTFAESFHFGNRLHGSGLKPLH
jgi:hypothetical protein